MPVNNERDANRDNQRDNHSKDESINGASILHGMCIPLPAFASFVRFARNSSASSRFQLGLRQWLPHRQFFRQGHELAHAGPQL